MMATLVQTGASVNVGHITDEALMEEFRQGSVRAFERLLRRHQRPVFNFFARHLGNPSVAEDLLQELFMRVIKAAPSYRPQAKFTTWMYTIARNLVIDESRRSRSRPAASLDAPTRDDGESLADRLQGREMAQDRRVMGGELHESLQRAVDSLLPEQREVFLMREFLNLRFKEIAEVVGVSENTVKSRMRYALEHLRQALEDCRDGTEATA
jgi:RNA polymerase sigma-70 factor, ECF subfamily